MKVYKENIERFKLFYNSDYYKKLNSMYPEYIKVVFESFDSDPDSCDSELYEELGEKFGLLSRKRYLIDELENNHIKLSSDIVCGRKQIVKHYEDDFDKWVIDYEAVRGNINLHFLWPKHKLPTINTYIYTKYLDRIDCLLYDIKKYFEGVVTPMVNAYENQITKIWLTQFENNFSLFINKMKLGDFVDDNCAVYDIASGMTKTIDHIYSYSEVKTTLSDYMYYLLRLNREGRFDNYSKRTMGNL